MDSYWAAGITALRLFNGFETIHILGQMTNENLREKGKKNTTPLTIIEYPFHCGIHLSKEFVLKCDDAEHGYLKIDMQITNSVVSGTSKGCIYM